MRENDNQDPDELAIPFCGLLVAHSMIIRTQKTLAPSATTANSTMNNSPIPNDPLMVGYDPGTSTRTFSPKPAAPLSDLRANVAISLIAIHE